MSDHSELKKLAWAATPGRWTAYDTHGRRFIEAIGTEDHVVCATPKKQWLKDSQYIAAADPVTVLALIAEIEVLREENAKLNSDNKSMRGLIRKRHKQHESRKQTLKHMSKKVEQQ